MLLNTWLAAAKRHLVGKSVRSGGRRSNPFPLRFSQAESLEAKSLLTALVINPQNVDAFVDTSGNLSVTNADLAGFDGLVIEEVTVNSLTEGISIDLSGIVLNRLAIETVTVSSFVGTGIDINLTNVTGNRTMSLEDIRITGSGTGIDLNLNNTDTYALTIEDSVVTSIAVTAVNGSDIGHGVVTQNEVSAPANAEAILLSVSSGSTADDFQIIDNHQLQALNRDTIRVDLVDAPLNGLQIANNIIGNEPGADVSFRAEGDTFVQPFELKNNATDGENLNQFLLDLTPVGLVFDVDAITGKPFTAINNSGVLTGVTPSLVPNSNNQILQLDFTDFNPGETLFFVIDVDTAPATPGGAPIDFSVFGRHLIGAGVDFSFGPGANSGAKQVSGTMVGDANVFNASEFARGAGTAADFHGINLHLQNSPLTNSIVSDNAISGVAGHGVLVSASQQSDVSAIFDNNEVLSSGQDGLHFELTDSNFTGAIIDNVIGVNGGHGINFQPVVTRKGEVEAAFDTNPVIITSTNHQLQTGDQIMIQGMVNDDPDVNHPGNGLHTVTRIDNNTFSLQGVSGLPSNVNYVGGGSWYIPKIQADGSARGLVEIDLQATEPQGRIQDILNPAGAGDVVVTSLDHGLATGDRVRISRAAGTGISGTQTFKVTRIDADSFSLDGFRITGSYDTSGGLATWTTNLIDDATGTGEVVITSLEHGLNTGDQVRVVGADLVTGLPSAANGTWTVTRLTADTFALQGSTANGAHRVGSGYWVPVADSTFTGDTMPQIISGNSIDGNRKAGLYVNLTTGTRFDGDIVSNTLSGNDAKGIHIESHSFGLGTDLPLDPLNPSASPSVQDLSFNVNIGTAATDGNNIDSNVEAGVVIEALDFATGSFEIQGNRINGNIDDANSATPYAGDGIVVRLESDLLGSEAVGFLSESIITDNQIGVDARGNQGNGLSFSLTDRTKIQDLEVTGNSFLNSGQDGFHFVRSADADLNSVIFEDNDATNNAGDGFDIFAKNTVKDRLDFQIRNSRVDNNGEYGLRVEVQADARIGIDVTGTSIRQNGASRNGFNPNDGAGATGAAGGVGIHGFQQVDVVFNAVESTFSDNEGDGFSIDAENFFDTLIVNASFTDSDINGNSLTGFRSVGTAFGTFQWTRSDFVGNGVDGARIISNVDVNDRSNRRVGGQDIDVIAYGNDFQLNGENGVVLGQGVSAVFGNGDPTDNFANEFGGRLDQNRSDYGAFNTPAPNGADGLKIVQDAGPYLREKGLNRTIQTKGNVFSFNGGDGVDIGHFVATEQGNVLHGFEVVSDTNVVIADADISSNAGDGVEYLADSVLRVPPADGSGQDLPPQPNISSLAISGSDIKNNGQRGVDVLNRVGEDSRVTLVNNEVIGNGFSGIYVLNTSTHFQLQGSPADPLDVEYWNGNGTPSRTPNIELRIQDNLIESNGTAAEDSTVPVNFSNDANNASSTANPDYHHLTDLIQGTLGGVVIRVGTTDSVGTLTAADPERELGLSGIDAEIWKNSFDGNFGADVYFDNFVSLVPPESGDHFNDTDVPSYRWIRGFRDPLARLDLVFRENSGNSLDVINGFAFLDNNERVFKSRTANGAPFPNADGFFSDNNGRGGTERRRNNTRTIGYLNNVGEVPSAQPNVTPAPGYARTTPTTVIWPAGSWSYDGWGTPTWRIESDFDFNNFQQTGGIAGFSDFYDVVNISNFLAEEHYQWDTGVNVPGFVGQTPYSLQRGDVFNVQTGEAPIAADSLEENDSFVGATRLLYNAVTNTQAPLSGTLSVNSLATGSNLNIDHKGDRDYYQFVAAASGTLTVDLAATDANGDLLRYLIYEIDPNSDSNEVPMVRSANGAPVRTSVNAGNSATLSVSVTAGRSYIVEVISNEQSNLGIAAAGKNFQYGTVRSYSLTINAPIAPAPVVAAVAGPVTTEPITTVTSPGFLAAVSIAGQNPFVQSFTGGTPTVKNSSTDTIRITFSEDVTGVDLADFRLTRDGAAIDITGAILNPIDATTYEISNLASFTAANGVYVVSLNATTSGIVDLDQAPLRVTGNESVTWTVDNRIGFTTDTTDNVPGDGLFADVNGNKSLRAAINEANANPGLDIISLQPGTYVLGLQGRFEDAGLSGDLDILGNLTIRGLGATALDTVIDGAQVDRIFHVFPGVQLTLENLTIRGGEAYDGAGVFVEGRQRVNGVPTGSVGNLVLDRVNVVNNEAYNQGGGIYNLGVVKAVRSSISQNVAGSRGGGVFNHSRLELLNSTVSTNTAVSRGGGIYNEILSSTLNTQISPSQAVGTLLAVNSTIAFNHADAAGGGLYQEGIATLQLGNTIVDSNTAGLFPDLNGRLSSLGNNFVGDLGGQTPAEASLLSTDIAADDDPLITNAGLNALAASPTNGIFGHTPTAGSLVVDAGSDAVYATNAGITVAQIINQVDQGGSPRLVEGNNDGVFAIDMGATEFFVSQPVAIITATPNPAGVGETVMLSAANSTHTLVPGTSKIVNYEWDFNYDGVNFTPDATGQTASTAYLATGDVTVALRVTDDTAAQDLETLVIRVDIPSSPVIVSPFQAGTSDSTPTIQWVAGSGTFALEIRRVDTNAVVIQQNGLTSNSFTVPTALTPGTYRAVVTATNASGSASSDPYDFVIQRIALTDPLNFDLVTDTTPEITFTAIPDAERYQVYVAQLDPADRKTSLGVPINDSFVDAGQAAIPGTTLAMYEPSAVLAEGVYRVWVRAFDAAGTPGDWSTGSLFTVTRPTITGPVPVSRVTLDSTPTITWTDVGAQQYEIWLSQVNGTLLVNGVPTTLTSPRVIINQIVQNATSFTPTTPLGDGDFRVWVRAIDPDGEAGLWSSQYNFTKNLSAGATLISPVNKVNVTDRTPVFEWQALDGADHYEIWVNNISSGIPRVIHDVNVPHVDGVTTMTYTDPSIVLRNSSYRWWIRAFNEDGEATAWSSFGQFFVPVPVINTPGGIVTTTNRPVIAWTGVPEYVRYELWINNDTTGQSRVIYENNLTTTSYTPALPLENGSFRAWVRGFDVDGNASQWSNPFLFDVSASVSNAPILIGAIGAPADNTPEFQWNALPNITQYEIVIKNLLTTGQPIVLEQVITPTTLATGALAFSPTTNLISGQYRWWIRGLNDDNSPGPYSQPLDFRIAAADASTMDDPLARTLLTSLATIEEVQTLGVADYTVHPAVVLTRTLEHDQQQTSDTSERSVEQKNTHSAVRPSTSTDQVVDSVMEVLANGDWLIELPEDHLHLPFDVESSDVAAVALEAAQTSDQESTADPAAALFVGASFAARGLLRKKKRLI
ncbi:MAG: hypothetical protein KDA81_02295 [Planctomycetaceae bacterium]|nr:hypothetical protein [Planctomycetaceae bacterium]